MRPEKVSQLWGQVTREVMRDLVRAMQNGQRDVLARDHLTAVVEKVIARETAHSSTRLSAGEIARLKELLIAEPGPFSYPAWLVGCVQDHAVDEVLISGIDTIYVRRGEQVTRLDEAFLNEGHLLYVINLVLNPTGRALGADSPAVWATFEDGTQMIAFLAARGTVANMRIKRE